MGSDLIQVKLAEVRPTQRTVGYEEVQVKRWNWSRRAADQKAAYIASHPFPAVRGPQGRYFIVDGHHLGLALIEEGVNLIWVRVLADFSHLAAQPFWSAMDQRGFLCPADENCRNIDDMPKTLRALVDDPYRSLVARLRRTCGCPKDRSLFAEFRWADYLRCYINLESLRNNPDATLAAARRLVREAFCPLASEQCQCIEET